MNLRRWMQHWQSKFGTLGVEVVVADVAQSSLVVDVAEGTVVLSPSLKVAAADNMLHKVYTWWRRQPPSSYPGQRLETAPALLIP